MIGALWPVEKRPSESLASHWSNRKRPILDGSAMPKAERADSGGRSQLRILPRLSGLPADVPQCKRFTDTLLSSLNSYFTGFDAHGWKRSLRMPQLQRNLKHSCQT